MGHNSVSVVEYHDIYRSKFCFGGRIQKYIMSHTFFSVQNTKTYYVSQFCLGCRIQRHIIGHSSIRLQEAKTQLISAVEYQDILGVKTHFGCRIPRHSIDHNSFWLYNTNSYYGSQFIRLQNTKTFYGSQFILVVEYQDILQVTILFQLKSTNRIPRNTRYS